MNDSYGDLASALAAERTRSMLTEARYDALARLARCCSPSRLGQLTDGVRRAGTASLLWLRKGQLAGYAQTCTTC